jgi:hypothetical protein
MSAAFNFPLLGGGGGARWLATYRWSSAHGHIHDTKVQQQANVGRTRLSKLARVWLPVIAHTCRWGATLIACRQDRLLRRGGSPVTDWADLLQPALKGKVAMVESSREFVGVALKVGLFGNRDKGRAPTAPCWTWQTHAAAGDLFAFMTVFVCYLLPCRPWGSRSTRAPPSWQLQALVPRSWARRWQHSGGRCCCCHHGTTSEL